MTSAATGWPSEKERLL